MSGELFQWTILVAILCVNLVQSSTKIAFPGCDRSGWKCNKVQVSPIRYEIEYVCQSTGGINFALWNFNAPAEIKHLKITNCSAVEIDLTCTNVGRQIEGLIVKNVDVLNFTNLLYKDVAQMPESVIFEDIKNLPLIPEKTFKQMKYPSVGSYRCALTSIMDKIFFSNVNIEKIDQNAFYNLTEMKYFTWKGVKVNEMSPLAMHVEMEKEKNFEITNCTFNKLEYKSFEIKSPGIYFQNNYFNELSRNAIDSTSFRFNFFNNTVQKIHSFAYILLSQDITFKNNVFHLLKTSALQGMGPGLLENAFMSFGQLQFTYTFNNNTVFHSDIGGLHPDWKAYKNVHSSIIVQSNHLPCSCKELGWITLRSGLGEEFSSMMHFNSKYLDENNNNLCLNSPCKIPVTVMAGMHIKFGLCGSHEPLEKWCRKYVPNKDFGFTGTAKMVLNKWQNDFPSIPVDEEISSNELEVLEDVFSMAQSAKINYLQPSIQVVKTSKGNPKESYFKIEKAGLTDVDPIALIEDITKTNLTITEPDSPETSTIPDIIFEDENTMGENGTAYKYNFDIRNNMNSIKSNNSSDVGFNNLKKEYEDNQKDFLKRTFEQWRAQRKKRMVYFNVYGNLVTLD